MQLTYNYIIIKNFRKHIEYNCEFCDGTNEFMGFNGAGKTTILDAITWCLFGKNFEDKKQFNVFPEVDGKLRMDLKPYVELSILKDGEEYIISREIYQTKSMKNPSTTMYINDVKFTIKEFEKYLDEKLGIDIEKFKMMSKTNYAINFKENDLRKLVYDEFKVDDNEILNHESNVGKFDNVKEIIEEFGIERTYDTINARRKEQKKKETSMLSVIENSKKKIMEVKNSIDKGQLRRDTDRKKEIKSILSQGEEEMQLENKKREDISNCEAEINQCQNSIKEIEMRLENKNSELKNLRDKMNYMFDLKNIKDKTLKDYLREMNVLKKSISEKTEKMKSLQEKLKKEKQSFDELKSKEVTIENDECPFCHQKLPQEFIENAKEEKENIKVNELKEMRDTINKKIHSYNEIREEYKNDCERYNQLEEKYNSLKDCEDDKLNTILNVDNDEYDKLKEEEKKILADIQELKKDGNNQLDLARQLKIKLDNLPKPIEIKSKDYLYVELENINNRLNNYNYYKNLVSEYNRQVEDYKENESKKEVIETMLSEYEQYKKYKDLLITKNIQKFFDNISFKTSYLTRDGKENNCFVVTLNGRDYSELSEGEKIQASVSLIRGLQKMNNYYFPILIDNFESLSELKVDDTQIVCCSAVKKPSKNIIKRDKEGNLVEVENPNYDKIMETYSLLQLKKY